LAINHDDVSARVDPRHDERDPAVSSGVDDELADAHETRVIRARQ
jgi:hypothetical protein